MSELLTTPARSLTTSAVLSAAGRFSISQTKFDVLGLQNLQNFECDRVEVIEDFAG
jgi:hypothetical protein